jgi:O-antigen/teichoic acid export membrane protein
LQTKHSEIDAAADFRSGLSRNSGAIAAARLASALTSVVAIPFVIGELGLARFGLWESIVALVSLTALVTDSVAGTLLWKMSHAWGGGDGRALQGLVRFGLAASVVLPGVLVPAALLLQPGVAAFLGVAIPDAGQVGRVFVALVALVVLSGINGTMGALNSAIQQVRVASIAQTAGQMVMYVVSIAGLRAGLDLMAMVIGTAVGQVTTTGILVVGARRVRTVPKPREFRQERAHVPAVRYFAVLSAGAGAAFLRGQADRLILAGLASPIWAGYYSIAARLSNLLMEVSNLFYVPTIAASGALMGARDWGGVRALYRSSMSAVSCTSAAVGLVLIGLPGPLVLLWVGEPVPEAASILRILAVGTLVAVAITGPGTAIGKGIGRPEIELRYVLVSFLINVVLTVGLVLTIGPIGTVIASSASWALAAFLFAWMIHTALKLPRVPTRRAAATLAGTGVAAGLVAGAQALMPDLANRRDAISVLAVFVPLGIAVLLAVSSRIGGVGYRDGASVVMSIWKWLMPRASRASEL